MGKTQLLEHFKVPAKEFAKKIESVIAHPNPMFKANITPYTADEYKGFRTYLSADKRSGYAVKPDGELFSVFSLDKGRGEQLLDDAVLNKGAKKLDAFDINGKLPKLYGKYMDETSRLKFADEYAPKDWNYEKLGRPDVVMMELNQDKLKAAAPFYGRTINKGVPSHVDWLKQNPQANAKFQALSKQQQQRAREFIDAGLKSGKLSINGKAVAAGATAVGALGAGQQSEASEGGATLKAATSLLEKIKTPEMAAALKGADRAEYLKALDTVYGDVAARQKLTGHTTDAYHGTSTPDIDVLNSPAYQNNTVGPGRGLGTFLTRNPEVAQEYGNQIMPLKVNRRKQVAIEPDNSTFTSDEAQQVRELFTDKPDLKNVTIKDVYDSPNPYSPKSDVIIVKDPSSVRSKFAAFDPRFKDSPLLLAGAAAMPRMGENGPTEMDIGRALKHGYEYFKENIQQPVADVISRGLQVPENAPALGMTSYEQSEAAAEPLNPAMQEIGRMAIDPVNALPIAGQLGVAGLEMMPENKAKGGIIMHPNRRTYKMADGGTVPDAVLNPVMNPGMGIQELPKPGGYINFPKESGIAQYQNLVQNGIPFTEQELAAKEEAAAPNFAPTIPSMQTPPEARPQTTPDIQGMMDPYAAMGKTQQGIGKLEAQQINEETKMQNEYAGKMQSLADQAQKNYTDFDKENSGLLQAIADNKIDPNRYINSQSTPAKVATIFGLLLGGLGQGLAGGENQALKMLNKQIDMDVDAQKANLQNMHNLYTANLHKFGIKKDAETATRLNYMEMYKAKLLAAGGAQRSEIAKQRALLAAQQLDAQMAPMKQELAIRQSILQHGQAGALNPSEVIPHLVPEKMQAKAFEESEKIQDKNMAAQHLNTVMQRIGQLQSTGHRLGSPFQSKSEIDALNSAIFSKAKTIFGKTSDSEIDILRHNNAINYTDDQQTIKRKIQAMTDMMGEGSSTPVLDAYLGPLGIKNYKYNPPKIDMSAPVKGMPARK
jgi:hypothetical protein